MATKEELFERVSFTVEKEVAELINLETLFTGREYDDYKKNKLKNCSIFQRVYLHFQLETNYLIKEIFKIRNELINDKLKHLKDIKSKDILVVLVGVKANDYSFFYIDEKTAIENNIDYTISDVETKTNDKLLELSNFFNVSFSLEDIVQSNLKFKNVLFGCIY